MKKEMFTPWDPADYINTPEDVFGYIEIALEENDPQFLFSVLGDIARSKGMAQLAKECGVTREGLYKTLSPKGNPSFKTVASVLNNMGFQLTVKPIGPNHKAKANAPCPPIGTAPPRVGIRITAPNLSGA